MQSRLTLLALFLLPACASLPTANTATEPEAAVVAIEAAPLSRTVAVTEDGGIRMGRADAPVTVVEYAALGCIHCRDAALASHDEVIALVDAGKINFEVRHMILNAGDIAATSLIYCQSPEQYFDTYFAWFSDWDNLIDGMQHAMSDPVFIDELKALDDDMVFRVFADKAGTSDFFMKQGMSRADVDSCLGPANDNAMLDKAAAASIRDDVSGTPTYFVNGELADHGWESARAAIDKALN